MPNVGRSAATTGAGSASENTFVFYDTSWVPFLCKIVNCGQLAFSEVRRADTPALGSLLRALTPSKPLRPGPARLAYQESLLETVLLVVSDPSAVQMRLPSYRCS